MLFCIAATGAILLYLSLTDLKTRLLENKLVALYALLFLPYAWLNNLDLQQFGSHLLVAVLSFGVLFALFMLGAMGGGDVKLGAAVFLWAGPAQAFPVLVIVAWTGGLVAVMGWLADRQALQGLGWPPIRCLRHALSARRGVPYGVALAAGGLFILWRAVNR
jgi:prepilin peptidase CpaA